jgi:ribonuclease HI
MRRTLVVYSDGACKFNPGPGGYGAIIYDTETGAETSTTGASAASTNGRMELTAAIEGIRAATAWHPEEPLPDIVLCSDATYVGWALSVNWRLKKLSKDVATNIDLILALHRLLEPYTQPGGPSIEYRWVKGHSGDSFNERADALARGAVEKLMGGIKLSNRLPTAKPYEDEDPKESTLSREVSMDCTVRPVPKYRLRVLSKKE